MVYRVKTNVNLNNRNLWPALFLMHQSEATAVIPRLHRNKDQWSCDCYLNGIATCPLMTYTKLLSPTCRSILPSFVSYILEALFFSCDKLRILSRMNW